MNRPLIVIFGAAVRPDGRPSPTLARRIGYGLAAARQHPEAPVLCSGGSIGSAPSEAAVMAEALVAEGVAPGRLILDEHSLNTLQNVQAAVAQLGAGGYDRVIACSDGYHLPRIRLMLTLLGVASEAGPVPRGPAGAPLAHWIGMSLREAAAILRSVVVLIGQRGRAAS